MRWLILACVLLLGFSIGFIFGPETYFWPQPDTSNVSETAPPGVPGGVFKPSPELSPDRVVEIQMAAMVACSEDRSQIHQVYAFASPANQATTGPLERFEKMILTPPYRAMMFNKDYQIGRPHIEDNYATVLVTLVDEQGKLNVYRFYLSLQTDEFVGCWMTDAVICIVNGLQPISPEPEPVDPPKKAVTGV